MLSVVADSRSLLLLVSLPHKVQLTFGFQVPLLYLIFILQHLHLVVLLNNLERFLASLQLRLIVGLLSLCYNLEIISDCLEAAQVLLLQLVHFLRRRHLVVV